MTDYKSKQERDFILADDRYPVSVEETPRPGGEITVQEFLEASEPDRTLMILAALQASPRHRTWLKQRQVH